MPEITYVGWGGRLEWIDASQALGYGSRRGFPSYGIRRAAWDACFGFVNGFPLRAIAYYVISRSLSQRLNVWFMRREGFEVRDGLVVANSSARFNAEWAAYEASKSSTPEEP